MVLILFLPLKTYPVFGEAATRSQEGRHVARIAEQIVPGVYRVDAVRIPGEGGGNALNRTLDAVGAGPNKLNCIYLTHHHSEHISGLPTIRWWAPAAELVTSEYEARIISGERPPDPLSDPLSSYIAVRGLPTVPMGDIRTISEGYEFAGFRVISTPGHTGGHTSLLNNRHRLLFTADAFGRIPEIRVGVNDAISTDPVEARRSAEKLLKEEFSTVIFSHGKPVRGEDVKQRLRKVVDRHG